MAKLLEDSGDYRVLRRLVPRDVFTSIPADQPVKIGIVLDVETTGLDAKTDEVIELGMVKFSYLPDDRIWHVIGTFAALNEPTNPIPPEITAINDITNELVAGQRIDPASVSSFVANANVI